MGAAGKQLAGMKLTREELLMKLGAARKQARTAWRLMPIEVAADSATLSYRLDRDKLRQARRREGRYLLRTNLIDDDPARALGLVSSARQQSRKPSKPSRAISPSAQSSIRIDAAHRGPHLHRLPGLLLSTSRWPAVSIPALQA